MLVPILFSAEFDLAKRGRELVNNYSGGMIQRVMIARALMHTPDVLFLDEPTNNLDPQARLFLWERIRVLQERGITILLTTHDMEEASRLCDRIAIMDHGHILVCDTPSELEKLIPGGTMLELRVSVPEHALASVRPSDIPMNSSAASQLQQALSSLPGVDQGRRNSSPKERREPDRYCRVPSLCRRCISTYCPDGQRHQRVERRAS